MCLPFQVIGLFMLPMIHLGWTLSHSFEVKEARGAVQISIWEMGINNPDGQVITAGVSAARSLVMNQQQRSHRLSGSRFNTKASTLGV